MYLDGPSIRSSVCLSVCYKRLLKTNKPILLPVCTSGGPPGKGMKRSTWASGGPIG